MNTNIRPFQDPLSAWIKYPVSSFLIPNPESDSTDIGMKPVRSPSGTPAPYGHACQSCAHAKCKCMLLGSGNGCER